LVLAFRYKSATNAHAQSISGLFAAIQQPIGNRIFGQQRAIAKKQVMLLDTNIK
jgi:hypothetical protein